jgi:hypothetical protein
MMSRIAVGMMIAIAALLMNGGLVRPVLAENLARASIAAPTLSTPNTSVQGHRSERVLSLLIALEALRAAPEVLEKR